MLPNSLNEMASLVGGTVSGNPMISGLAIDSRKAVKGDLFVALTAERDGHDYIANAAESGASAALVTKPTTILPSICVTDTLDAMTALASGMRDSYPGQVFALTGSQGKTSTRGFLASILTQMARRSGSESILVTQGNLNNHLGVPLTMARLRPHHPYALFELGASAVGEIDHLASIVRPQISALLNARAAHLEGFGSIAGVIQGKGEIIDQTAIDGTVVLNRDEPAFDEWVTRAGSRHVISVGRNAADLIWSQTSDQVLEMRYGDRELSVSLLTLGQHFIENAALASAIAIAAGATDQEIIEGLEAASIEPGRMTPIQLANTLLVDDTYNASPQAVRAAIDWLATRQGVRVLAMGGLSELGESAESEMHALGTYAKSKGIECLVATGTALPIAEGYGADAQYFPTHDEVSSFLIESACEADVILVKGSRSAQMDCVVNTLKLQQGGH
jgi:UDP-N-acetylmuramoyl-tripeptide--D-alanyl-D-alanine ligase